MKILIAMHKPYWIPRDKVYMPIWVGRKGKVDKFPRWTIQGDDTGDNISEKNPHYCELTAMYWAWKNLDCEYIGLCHYRRYFIKKILGLKLHINRRRDFERAMQQCDALLPDIHYTEGTVYRHYAAVHHELDLKEAGNIIAEKYPEYKLDFDAVMRGNRLYLYNMFCMKKTLFDRYCEWLFTILFELEKRIDISGYDSYQTRVFGFISERLFIVWLRHQSGLTFTTQEVMSLEKPGWRRQITLWLQRKLY